MTRYLFILIIFCSNVSANELLNITFLGTGTPRPNINKLGPSVLIKVKHEEIMLDVGRGTTLRLNQIGNNYSQINNIYVSHLHFDHIIGIPDFWLTSNLWQKKTDTNIFGPIGIKKFCEGLRKSFSKDFEYRYSGRKNSKIICRNYSENNIIKNNLLKVISFKNNHGHIDHSHGFKVLYKNKSIVYSGDTTYSKEVVKNAKNCDILIHEIIATTKKIHDNNKKLQSVISTHTNISQLIKVLNESNPKLTILNHALLFGVSEEYVLNEVRKLYDGEVIFSQDLMSVDLGEEINIFNIGN